MRGHHHFQATRRGGGGGGELNTNRKLAFAKFPNRPTEKNSGLKGIRTHNLCDAGAVGYQVSYQANWELVIL